MEAGKHNLEITKGKTFIFKAIWTDPNDAPINLTGRTIRMQIRRSKDSSTTYIDFDSDLKGGITKVNATGEFTVTIPVVETSTFDFVEAVYEIDSVVSLTGAVEPILEGRVIMDQGVIR